MKAALIITEDFSPQQMENSYLLSLALLNFELQVSVVFVNQAFKSVMADATRQKQWLALKVYGAKAFYHLNLEFTHNDLASKKHCQQINQTAFNDLKNSMDLLL